MPNLHVIKDHFKESQLYLNRTVAAVVIIFLLLLILVFRLVFLQIYQHDLYKTLSLNNQVRVVPITPARGLIFDRHGVLLAENIPAFNLEITRERTPNIEETLDAINEIMPITESERIQFQKQLKNKRRHEGIPLRVKLTEEEVAKFSVEKHRLPGVDVVARLIRYYPLGETMAHAIGYIGPINEKELEQIDQGNYRGTYSMGKVGLEKFYEDELHGKTGYQHIETDAKGRTIRVLNRIPPTAGKELHLSIDSHLQKACYEALKDLKGAIVAIDPSNGDILALVSNPSFDPNLFTQGIEVNTYKNLQQSPDKPLFNRAIQGQYSPGSTVKPMVALKGLELGLINSEFSIWDPGYYQLNGTGRLYRDMIYFSKRHGHGQVDLEKAIMQSCDTFFFMLAHKIGIHHMHDIYARFGLGKPTNTDIAGEVSGLLPSPEWKRRAYNQAWYAGDTLNIGIGQGTLLATPLQMANMTAILANRGLGFKPRLVSSMNAAHSETSILQAPQQTAAVNLKADSHWDMVINAMQKVVHTPGGTAYRISQGLRYQIAGKTGTAQVFSLKQNEKYDANRVKAHLRDHSWFIGFSPIENPRIALAVLIENKQNKAGADIARIVFDSYFNSKTRIETSDTMGEDESYTEEMEGAE